MEIWIALVIAGNFVIRCVLEANLMGMSMEDMRMVDIGLVIEAMLLIILPTASSISKNRNNKRKKKK